MQRAAIFVILLIVHTRRERQICLDVLLFSPVSVELINQGEGGHNVCLIKTKNGIRKMTPHECFNAQGFSQGFKLPKDMSDGRLYKQAGNSVCVSVIARIADSIAEAYALTSSNNVVLHREIAKVAI